MPSKQDVETFRDRATTSWDCDRKLECSTCGVERTHCYSVPSGRRCCSPSCGYESPDYYFTCKGCGKLLLYQGETLIEEQGLDELLAGEAQG